MSHHPAVSRTRTASAICLLTSALLAATAGQLPGTAHAADTVPPGATSLVTGPAALPFVMPTTAALRSSPKLVFAHYFTPSPVSIDNQLPSTDYYARNYLTPGGESGKHAAYGGLMRDRPMPRDPLSVTDWRLQDMETEVRQAIAAGIDGFTLDILQIQGDRDVQVWANANLMMQAAHAVDPEFKVMIYLDLTGGMAGKTPDALAQAVAQLAKYPSAYRLSDGRLVLGVVAAEAHSATWWQQFLDLTRTTYGIPTAFLPTFIANEQNYAAAFAPISYGMSNWGSRNPKWNDPTLTYGTSPRGRAAAVKALGQKWMQPVSIQDERPNQGVFDEAQNTENLRDTWALARLTDADFVQLPTWNDYSEGAQTAPSAMHGWSYLDLTSYYLAWYKTGTAPKINTDGVYLTHRTQPVAAQPTYPQTTLMSLRGGSPGRDTVEALTFLTAPGNVVVTVGSKKYLCAVNAGVDTCTVPLGAGSVSAVVSRAGVPVAGVQSTHRVTTTPYVQDLQYVAASSGRTPADAGVLAAGTADGAQYVTRTTVVTADADSYANYGAPSNNYGSTSTLSSRGNVAAASYLHFPAPVAPSGTTLTGAVLRLRSSTDSSAGSVDTQSVQLVTGSWTESGLTWRNRPLPVSGAVGTLSGGTVTNRTYDVPLQTSVVSALVGGSTLAITSTGTDEARFFSSDYADLTARPQLLLTYSPVTPIAAPTGPSSPTALRSSLDGTSVTLSWATPTTGTAATGFDVQTSASGVLVTTHSVTATTVTTQPGPGTWTYRVLARDAAGRVSAPSAPLAVAVPATAPTTTSTLLPTADAYANEGAPSDNYGRTSSLSTRGHIGATSYLRFALPTAPAGTVLAAARLGFRTKDDSFAGSTDAQVVQLAGGAWDEAQLSWLSRPGLTGSPLGTLSTGTRPSTSYSVPLSTSALAARAGSSVTLAMTSAGTDSMWLWSSEYGSADARPQLVLTYKPVAVAPQGAAG